MKHSHVIYPHIYVLTIVDDPQIYISNLALSQENVNPRIYADSDWNLQTLLKSRRV